MARFHDGLTTQHIQRAMNDFLQFLGFINQQLHAKGIQRFETMLMPASFSGMVGEFMIAGIPKYCRTLVKNQYHNGHPDLIPVGRYPRNAVLHEDEGIEVKSSRHFKGWQGHNPEDTWLMVFVFESNRPSDAVKGIPPKPFRFLQVVGARLTKSDWLFAGRSEKSRRTITASVTASGYQKMTTNWIYRGPLNHDGGKRSRSLLSACLFFPSSDKETDCVCVQYFCGWQFHKSTPKLKFLQGSKTL